MKTSVTVMHTAYPEILVTDMKPGDIGVFSTKFPGEVIFATHAGWFTNTDRVWLKDNPAINGYVRLLLPGDSVTIKRTA